MYKLTPINNYNVSSLSFHIVDYYLLVAAAVPTAFVIAAIVIIAIMIRGIRKRRKTHKKSENRLGNKHLTASYLHTPPHTLHCLWVHRTYRRSLFADKIQEITRPIVNPFMSGNALRILNPAHAVPQNEPEEDLQTEQHSPGPSNSDPEPASVKVDEAPEEISEFQKLLQAKAAQLTKASQAAPTSTAQDITSANNTTRTPPQDSIQEAHKQVQEGGILIQVVTTPNETEKINGPMITGDTKKLEAPQPQPSPSPQRSKRRKRRSNQKQRRWMNRKRLM